MCKLVVPINLCSQPRQALVLESSYQVSPVENVKYAANIKVVIQVGNAELAQSNKHQEIISLCLVSSI